MVRCTPAVAAGAAGYKGGATISELQRLQRFIRLADLPSYVGLRRTQIAELIKAGEFPKPIRISDTGRAVAWLESEVLAWQAQRIAKRHEGAV